MFDAQLLVADAANFDVYGPWIPREGDNALFSVDVQELSLTGAAQFQVQLETKGHEDAGNGSAISPLQFQIAITSAGQDTQLVSGQLQDMVRYRFIFNDDAAAGDWVLFRMLPPIWFDAVDL
jgi:hypothetical protein